MRALLVGAALLAGTTAAVRTARADGCHGGHPGGGGGAGHGAGASNVDAGGSGCSEVSDVVGYQRCGHFGDGWAGRAGLLPFTAEVGFFSRQLHTGMSARGVMAHDTGSFAYQVTPEEDLGTAAGAALRLALALPAHVYVGTEVELGGLVSGARADVAMTGAGDGPGPSMTAHESLYMAAGGVAGVRGRLGPAVLAAEVVAGVRDVSLSVDSSYGACTLSDTHHRTAGFVEPRVKLDFWLSPWITVAGFAGSELDGQSRMVGASVAFHVRAFDRGR